MTNMSKKELKRIVDQKLSPLYISVHATDVDLRRKLLLYKWGKDDFLLKKVKYLIDNGIELHGQIVLLIHEYLHFHLVRSLEHQELN